MEDLLARLRRREPSAFQEVMLRYAPPLQRMLEPLLRDREEAEDLVQESFVKLFLNLDSVRSLRPWLFRVAVNLARTSLRRRSLSRSIPPPRMETPPETGEWKDLLQVALGELSEKTRTAFLLREAAGLTTEEVAEVEGCSPEAVRQRILEARRKLREDLRPYFSISPAQGV